MIIHSLSGKLLVLKGEIEMSLKLRNNKTGVSNKSASFDAGYPTGELVGAHDEYEQVGIPISYIRWTRCCASVALILGLFCVLAIIIGYVSFNKKIEDVDMIAMIKSDVLQLQICKNNTKDGVSVQSDSINFQPGRCSVGGIFTNCRVPGGPCTAPVCVQEFDTELWDDADFWDPGAPKKIVLPRDGRYAIGVQCSILHVPGPDKITILVAMAEPANPNGILLCKSSNFAPPLFTSNAVYCEAELQKQTENFIVVGLKSESGGAVNSRCTASVRQIGPLTGTGYAIPP